MNERCVFCVQHVVANAIKAKCKMCKSKYLNVLFWAWSDAPECTVAVTATTILLLLLSLSYARILHFVQCVYEPRID